MTKWKNSDPRIDAHIEKAAPFAKPILRHVRELVHEACPDVEETWKWSFPTFTYRGKILAGMSAFKEHCTFGFWHQGMTEVLEKEGVKESTAMGSFGKIRKLADLPSDSKLRKYIQKAAALNESDAPARPRPVKAPAKPLSVPDDLAAGLKKNRAAGAAFEKMSPSHRNEYVQWITEAKREETRQKRLATALEWLAEGKARNWKYENC